MTPGVVTSPEPKLASPSPSRSLNFSPLDAGKALAVTALVYMLFWDVLSYMASDWWNYDAYSQGMLLPPLALYIAWLQRRRILSLPADRDWRGLLVTGAACAAYLIGKLASEFFLMRISFVVLIAGLALTFWGMPRLKALTFPILLLATMVPLPSLVFNSLAAPLQLFASDVATRMAQTWGVSIFRDGNILQLANATLGVAEACSGLNSLSALVVGSVLVGYLICNSVLGRLLVFLSAVPLAIAVNVLRVAGTAILADYNQEFAMGFYHSFSGWLVFVAGIGLLFACARLVHAVVDSK